VGIDRLLCALKQICTARQLPPDDVCRNQNKCLKYCRSFMSGRSRICNNEPRYKAHAQEISTVCMHM
jgi:hypothetical protein